MNAGVRPNMKPIFANTIEDAMQGPWFWMRCVACERSEILAHLGEPHWTVSEDGLLFDYHHWVFQADCGFRVCYSFSADGPPEGAIHTCVPEDDHLLRHDPWCKNNSQRRDDVHFETDIRRRIESYSEADPILGNLHSFQVWRMGDDGNEMNVGYPTSEINARCHVTELESHKHKQIYWYRRCTDAAEPNDARKSSGRPRP